MQNFLITSEVKHVNKPQTQQTLGYNSYNQF